MLQKTVETYPESADAHSLYAQVCRKFKAEEILIHGASNLLDQRVGHYFSPPGVESGQGEVKEFWYWHDEIYLIPPQSSAEGPPLIGS